MRNKTPVLKIFAHTNEKLFFGKDILIHCTLELRERFQPPVNENEDFAGQKRFLILRSMLLPLQAVKSSLGIIRSVSITNLV